MSFIDAAVLGLLPYAAVSVAAVIEGEIAYISAATLVAQGHLNAVGVLLAGALGAATGDQAYFYLFRGRLPRWLSRYPRLRQKAAPLIGRVQRHGSLMVLLIRFAPGLRIALAAACAWVEVAPLKFTLLNLLSAFAWATGLLVVVAWFGPAVLAQYGLVGWKGALLIALVVFGGFKVLGRFERRTTEHSNRT